MKKLWFIIFSVLVIGAAWLYSDLWMKADSLRLDLKEKEDQIVSLDKTILEKEEGIKEKEGIIEGLGKQLSAQDLLINYLKPEVSTMITEADTKLYVLPSNLSKALKDVQKGTIVKVIQIGEVTDNNEKWLYVEVPLYADTYNNRGWIMENMAVSFSKEKEIEVTNPLTLRAGSQIYTNLEDIDKKVYSITEKEMRVYLIRVIGNYACCGIGGDKQIWTFKSNLIYPQAGVSS